MFKTITTLNLFFLFSFSAFAELPILGSHVVVCQQGTNQSVRLFEYYQSERDGVPISLGAPRQQSSIYLNNALNRLQRLSKLRMERYKEFLKNMSSEWKEVPSLYIGDEDPVAATGLPKNCSVKQIALQKAPTSKKPARYVVDRRYWNQLPELDKAGFIFHQFVLREILEYSKPSSKSVRDLNVLISTGYHTKIKTIRNWSQFLFDRGFVVTDMCGAWSGLNRYDLIDDEDWHNTGYPKNSFTISQNRFRDRMVPKYLDSIFETPHGKINIQSKRGWSCSSNGGITEASVEGALLLTFNGWELKDRSSWYQYNLKFDEFGRVRYININAPYDGIEIFGQNLNAVYDIGISESGKINYLNGFPRDNDLGYEREDLIAPVQNQKIKIYLNLDLFENGSLKRAILKDEVILLDKNGVAQTYLPENELVFSPSGRVISAVPVF